MMLDYKQIQSKLDDDMPEKLKPAFQKVVKAGMRFMFGDKTSKFAIEQIQKEGAVADNVAEGVINLMALLYKQSNNTMPGEVIIPAGLFIMYEAFDFIEGSGMKEISPNDVAVASHNVVMGIYAQFGGDPEDFKAQAEKAAAEAGGAEEAMPEDQPAEEPMPEEGAM